MALFTLNEMTPPVVRTDGAGIFCRQQSKGQGDVQYLLSFCQKINSNSVNNSTASFRSSAHLALGILEMNRRPHAQDHRADGWQHLDEVADGLLVDQWKIWWQQAYTNGAA